MLVPLAPTTRKRSQGSVSRDSTTLRAPVVCTRKMRKSCGCLTKKNKTIQNYSVWPPSSSIISSTLYRIWGATDGKNPGHNQMGTANLHAKLFGMDLKKAIPGVVPPFPPVLSIRVINLIVATGSNVCIQRNPPSLSLSLSIA